MENIRIVVLLYVEEKATKMPYFVVLFFLIMPEEKANRYPSGAMPFILADVAKVPVSKYVAPGGLRR